MKRRLNRLKKYYETEIIYNTETHNHETMKEPGEEARMIANSLSIDSAGSDPD
jgi:hypothetical protein